MDSCESYIYIGGLLSKEWQLEGVTCQRSDKCKKNSMEWHDEGVTWQRSDKILGNSKEWHDDRVTNY